MVDLHSHVLLHPYDETTWDDQALEEPVACRIMLAGRGAAAILQAGFTTLRDLGTEGAGSAPVHRHEGDRRQLQLRPGRRELPARHGHPLRRPAGHRRR